MNPLLGEYLRLKMSKRKTSTLLAETTENEEITEKQLIKRPKHQFNDTVFAFFANVQNGIVQIDIRNLYTGAVIGSKGFPDTSTLPLSGHIDSTGSRALLLFERWVADNPATVIWDLHSNDVISVVNESFRDGPTLFEPVFDHSGYQYFNPTRTVVRELVTGKNVVELRTVSPPYNGNACFSGDDARIICSDWFNPGPEGVPTARICVSDLSTGKVCRVFTGHHSLAQVASPAGQNTVVSMDGGTLLIWKYDDGEILHRFRHFIEFEKMTLAINAVCAENCAGWTIIDTNTGAVICRSERPAWGARRLQLAYTPGANAVIEATRNVARAVDASSGQVLFSKVFSVENWGRFVSISCSK